MRTHNPKSMQEAVLLHSNQFTDFTDLSPADPFNGYFHDGAGKQVELHPILQKNRMAQRWLNDINQTLNNGLYTFHQATQGKYGQLVKINNREFYQLSSYDYLGLSTRPDIHEAVTTAMQRYGTSTGGARLLAGSADIHTKLEKKIANTIGTGAAVTFTSGYLANLAAITGLIQKTDRVIVDAYVHRSIVDALHLAQLDCERFEHNNIASLRELLSNDNSGRKTFVIVEGVYSMDGDICPLPEIVELKYKHNFFIILDESHSFGNIGPSGRGVCEHYGVRPQEIDVFTSSLYKAIPAGGGFVAANQQVIIYLQHGASAAMFSAAMPPAAAAAASAGLDILKQEGKELIKKLHSNTGYLRNGLKKLGFNTRHSQSSIIPVVIGNKELTLMLSVKLYELGFLATPVVFPAVPPGGDRLRVCVTAAQTKETLDKILTAFEACMQVIEEQKKAA
jgi:8-amino-7-oxononanoate synthase